MTTINDEIRIKEGETNQTYSKLYVNEDKELHFVDSSGTDIDLSQDNITSDGYSIKRVFVLESPINKTATDIFVTYTIPANTLEVGSTISVVMLGTVTSYTSGTVAFFCTIGDAAVCDTDNVTPANTWQFYGHGSATISSTGVSGSMPHGGMSCFGTSGVASSIPLLLGSVASIDTTSDINIAARCTIASTATLTLRQFIINITL